MVQYHFTLRGRTRGYVLLLMERVISLIDLRTVAIQKLDNSIHHVQESNQPTIDAIVAEKRRREEEEAAQVRRAAQIEEEEPQGEGEGEEGLEGLEEEADQQGAFNPETGEINWDCPCLGGMAHGPCGDEFRAAFSCFVYSDQEPKGVECIEKFK